MNEYDAIMASLFENHGSLTLNCTDGGQHKRPVFLAQLQFVPSGDPARSLRGQALAEYDGSVTTVATYMSGRPTAAERKAFDEKIARNLAQGKRVTVSDPRVTATPKHKAMGRIGTSWRFVCPRCRRDYRISEATLRRLAETQLSVIDLSLTDM